MKVAIVHYWLVNMRGGEKVVEALGEIFPDADIFTHVYDESRISDSIKRHTIKTTFIAWLPWARKYYQKYLPLMPFALEQLDLQEYDLVISSESGPSKGVMTRPDALHICYCHTPMRYVWSGYHAYHGRAGRLTRLLMPAVMHRMRMWDLASASRVDHFIANSRNVARRIEKYYRRSATVIYPPVEMPQAAGLPASGGDYLFVSQLVPYKCADVVIEAFNVMGKPLVVIGSGEEYGRLSRLCGPTVTMLGWQDDESLARYYAGCRALVFIADEDFGIVPVEAMSMGRPVIAFGKGGALETVVPGETGVLFGEQTVESLINAVDRFETIEASFDPIEIASRAQAFSRDEFNMQVAEVVGRWLEDHRQNLGEGMSSRSTYPWTAPADVATAAIA